MMKKFVGIALGAALLSGCTYSGPVAENRVLTDVQRDGVTITGRYDPNGFSSAEIRRLVANVCNSSAIQGYTETPVDGQVAIQFTCRDGNPYGAFAGVNFTRTGAATADFSAVFSDANGELIGATGAVRF